VQNLPFFNNLCFNCPNYRIKDLYCEVYDKNCVLIKSCDYCGKIHKEVNPEYPLGDGNEFYEKQVNPAYPLGDGNNLRVSVEYENGIPMLYGVFTENDLKLDWRNK